MATENKGVMVYLPKEVEEYITSFCTEYNITRKDKEGNVLPSLGTGVVTYLKSKISGESPDDILTKPSRIPGTGLSREEVLDLISEYSTSHSLGDIPSVGLSKDEVLDLVKNELLSTSPVRHDGEPTALAELKEYIDNQIAAVRTELRAIGDRFSAGEATPTVTTEPVASGEPISFSKLAKQLDYPIPEGVSPTNPQKTGADDLIAFAASLGQSYKWRGKNQRFYRIEV
jgi:hypothetical protein